MTEYVHISFKGENGIRNVWAEAGTVAPDGKLSFWRVKRDGDRPNPEEVIIGSPDKFTIRPAKMNLHYGNLEVLPEPDAHAALKARLYDLKTRGFTIEDIEGVLSSVGDMEGVLSSDELCRHYRWVWEEMEAENSGCPDLVHGDQDNAICPKCGMVWSPTWQEKPACKMFPDGGLQVLPEPTETLGRIASCPCGVVWDPDRDPVPNCSNTCLAQS